MKTKWENASPTMKNHSVTVFLMPLPQKFLLVLKKKKLSILWFLVAYLDKPHWDWILWKVNINNTVLVLCYQSLALWRRLSTRVSTSRGGHLSTGTELRSQTCLTLPYQQMSGWQLLVTVNEGKSQTRWEVLYLLSNPLGQPIRSLKQYLTDHNSK